MYLFTLIIIFISALAVATDTPKYLKLFILLLAWAWLSCFIGLRMSGWDAHYYATLNDDAISLTLDALIAKYQINELSSIETGYLIGLHLFSYLFDPLVLFALITVGIFYRILKIATIGNFSLAIAIAFTPWYGLWDIFNAPRQSTSIILASFSLFLLTRLHSQRASRKLTAIKTTAVFILIISVSLHTSTFVFIIFYLIYIILKPSRYVLLLLSACCYVKPFLPSVIDTVTSLSLPERYNALLSLASITFTVSPLNFKTFEILCLTAFLALYVRLPAFTGSKAIMGNPISIFTYYPLFGASLAFLFFSEVSIAWERLTLPFTILLPISFGNSLHLIAKSIKAKTSMALILIMLLFSTVPYVTYRYYSLFTNSSTRGGETSHLDVLFPYRARIFKSKIVTLI